MNEDACAEVREGAPGKVRVKLLGVLNAWSTGTCWRYLETELRPLQVKVLEVEAGEVTISGGIGAALLRYLTEGEMTPGARIEVRGLSQEAQNILETFTAEDYRTYRRGPAKKKSIIAEIGGWTRGLWQDVREQIAFLGSVIRAVPFLLAHPKRLRWREIRRVMEAAGANAVPVVSVISVLVGMVVVLEAAHPLAKFGAQIFLGDMIGFSSLRDTGPVVTAILLAGRSGSAFAAELGTMKVNQELDALTTMGLNPIRFLVVQRLLAAFVLTPLLTLYAMLMGIVGGMLVMRSLGFPPIMVYHQIMGRVGINDFVVGLTKAAIFGVIIGGMACLRGLQTGTGPSAVGVSTTRSVVACILLIILANTLYGAAQYFWK